MTKDEALRMAIEFIESKDTFGIITDSLQAKVIQACKDALEQPTAEQSSLVQEPILIQWYDEEEDVWENTDERHYQHYANTGHKIRFLYTTPPSREWQSLSDVEIEEATGMQNQGFGSTYYMVIRAIEAKLREKNNGA